MSVLARPLRGGLRGQQPEQGAAAEEGTAEGDGAAHRVRAGERLVLRLTDRAIGVEGLEIEHPHHPLMKPVAVTAAVTWSMDLAGCSALGAG